ncbi:putative N-acetylmuramoyl-L-alanine amidase [Paenibacillus sp. 598K]|uniref:N-acetylmuramoyl-L-alanine amidase n=1 Tax=Paenibacillus sp. 598K TaxID=1117987 RepID=UPI000FF93DDA|nr:N-acetylmuramoyl-L-alanine amidase [Paenibacillus sp. 598K]GBF73196.1 putative N-acetylmuramoyl-L-alanine amidase [Paenibacillus sp. 598K]
MRAVIDHIPKSTPYGRRSGQSMVATTITIHNTGNAKSTARNERAWLTNPSNVARASYHIVVDEREAIECIPVNERALHAGTAAGNNTSIGIEICESGNYAQTLTNAVKLVAAMLRERGWGVDRLRRHYDWSRKICPRLMYDGGSWAGWEAFKARVAAELKPAASPRHPTCRIVVNGKEVASGLLIDGRAYAPLRAVGEAAGHSVGWDNASKTASVGGKPVAGLLLDGVTYVALRAAGEAVGGVVAWDGPSKTASITV